MKLCPTLTSVAALAATLLVSAYALQSGQEDKQAPAATPAVAQATAEHRALQKMVGTWDAKLTMSAMPGETSTATEVTQAVGEYWVVSDFSMEFMKQPFRGHHVMGFDPAKKKFVSAWVDSMSSYMATGEGTWDEATQSITMTVDGRDESGAPVREKHVSVLKDPDTMVFHMYHPLDTEVMTIEYKRRK
jgi:uncharacterized protein DUF1579